MNTKSIILFALVVFSGIILAVLVAPKIGDVQNARASLAKQKEIARILKERFEITEETISQFYSIEEKDLALIESAFPDEAGLPDIFVVVNSLVVSSGLVRGGLDVDVSKGEKLQSVKQKNVFDEEFAPGILSREFASDINKIEISVKMLGNYESFKVFLSDVEKSLRIFDIQSISFDSKDSSGEESGDLRIEAVMRTYYNQVSF